MKKVLVMVALVMISVIVYAFNDSRETNQGKKEVTGNSEVWVSPDSIMPRHHRPICRLVRTMSPDSSYHERIGKGICRKNCHLQSQCR